MSPKNSYQANPAEMAGIWTSYIILFQLFSTDAVAVTKTQAYGIGIGNIYFDEVSCLGTESDITECRHAGVGRHDCAHLEDAAVLCRRKTI